MNRVEQMKKIQLEALELFTRKNIDYGDAFAKYGVIGVLMRIEDKLQRSMSITKNGVNLINDEGIRDTLIDLHNYAAMALMESEPTVASLPSNHKHVVRSQNPGSENSSVLTPIERAAVRSLDPPRKRQDSDFDITFNEAYEECNHRNINLR